MSNIDPKGLDSELHRLSLATNIRDVFHQFLAQAAEPRQIPGSVEVKGGNVQVQTLGHTVTAIPRPVKVGTDYAIEYNFNVAFHGKETSVWRAYLWDGGILTQQLKWDSGRVCDYNNEYVKQKLLAHVTMALLYSPVFSPTSEGDAG